MTVANPRPALRTYLLADSAISDLVGGDRIYPQILPQGMEDDSVAYTRVSEQSDHHMQGPSGLCSGRFQINAWSKNADDACTLADLIKARIDGFSGEIEFGDADESIVVQGIFAADGRELYDDVKAMFGMSRDYLVWYAER